MKKLLVIGNCQARPVLDRLCQSDHFTALSPIVLHLATPAQFEAHKSLLESADIIVSQNTADTFPLPHLRSATLRDSGKPTVIWPNIFYSGQQPFLRYFTHGTEGRLEGPIEASHDLRIYGDWLDQNGIDNPHRIGDELVYLDFVHNRSLADLGLREQGCDVIISDIIRDRFLTDRLFFTFNHPTRLLIDALADRILTHLSYKALGAGAYCEDEPLDRYIVPSRWPDGPPTFLRGDRIQCSDNGRVERVKGPPEIYSPETLRDAFFSAYDHNVLFRHPGDIRVTPDYGNPNGRPL